MRTRDLYKLLQVDPAADPDVIRAAYRCLARKRHPDVAGGSSEQMAALNAAWDVLRDPIRRARYDRSRLAGAPFSADDDGREPRPDSTSAPAPTRHPGTGLPGRPGSKASAAGAARPQVDYAGAPRMAGTSSTWSTGSSAEASVLDFGRYAGWSLADLARHDPDFLEWLARTPIGRRYQPEIVAILASQAPPPELQRAPEPARRRRRLF